MSAHLHDSQLQRRRPELPSPAARTAFAAASFDASCSITGTIHSSARRVSGIPNDLSRLCAGRYPALTTLSEIPPLQDSPEVARYVDVKGPPSITQAARDIEPEEIKEDEAANAHRGMPSVLTGNSRIENTEAPRIADSINPRCIDERSERKSLRRTTITSKLQGRKWYRKLQLEKLR